MWIKDIIYKKYGYNGYNNPTDFFVGLTEKLPERKDGKKRIYFTGLPEHGNMGDQAIAYAIHKFVDDNDYEIISSTMSQFLRELGAIRRDCKKEDIFFLIGGGNMGVAYFGNEEVRRMIIKMFPFNRIIIFPQTIDYGDSEKGKQELLNATKIYGNHRDLHIFAREAKSYSIMKQAFPKNNVYLVPDIVYSLCYDNTGDRNYILKCIRNDRESSLKNEEMKYLDKVLKETGKVVSTDTVEAYVPIITSEEIRRKLIYRKLDEFARAKFVVTDRLHGMIFSVITNTPCVVLNNYNHKLISSYKTWLSDFGDVYFVDDLSQFEDLIKSVSYDKDHMSKLDNIRDKYDSIKKLL